MLYVYANVKIKYGRLPAFNEAMVTVKRVMEASGWRLVGGWTTIVGDLHEVQFELTGHGECFGQRLDADLLPVVSHQSDLSSSDPIVDPRLAVGRRGGYRQILFI